MQLSIYVHNHCQRGLMFFGVQYCVKLTQLRRITEWLTLLKKLITEKNAASVTGVLYLEKLKKK